MPYTNGATYHLLNPSFKFWKSRGFWVLTPIMYQTPRIDDSHFHRIQLHCPQTWTCRMPQGRSVPYAKRQVHTHCFANFCKTTQFWRNYFWFYALCMHIIFEKTFCIHIVWCHATLLHSNTCLIANSMLRWPLFRALIVGCTACFRSLRTAW